MSDNVTSQEFLFTDRANSQQLIFQFAPVVDLLIYRLNYKVMWVFPKRRFDVVLYTFNPQTGKKFYMHLSLF